MTPLGIAKTALVIVGMLIFLVGIRTANEYLRWIGIACVAIAWLLRFAKPANASASTTHPSSEDPP